MTDENKNTDENQDTTGDDKSQDTTDDKSTDKDWEVEYSGLKGKYDERYTQLLSAKEGRRTAEDMLSNALSLSPKGDTPEEKLRSLQSHISNLQTKVTESTAVGRVREELVSLGVVDPAVTDAAYSYLKHEDVLDNDRAMKLALEDWKKDHPSLFKQEKETVATKPVVKPKIEIGDDKKFVQGRMPTNEVEQRLEELKREIYPDHYK